MSEESFSQLDQAWYAQREANRADPGPSPNLLEAVALGSLGGGLGGAALGCIGGVITMTAPLGQGLIQDPLFIGVLGVSAIAGAVIGASAMVWEQRKTRKDSVDMNEKVSKLEQNLLSENPSLSSLLLARREKVYGQVDADAETRAKNRRRNGMALGAGFIFGQISS